MTDRDLLDHWGHWAMALLAGSIPDPCIYIHTYMHMHIICIYTHKTVIPEPCVDSSDKMSAVVIGRDGSKMNENNQGLAVEHHYSRDCKSSHHGNKRKTFQHRYKTSDNDRPCKDSNPQATREIVCKCSLMVPA